MKLMPYLKERGETEVVTAALAPNLNVHSFLPAPAHDGFFRGDADVATVETLHFVVAHFNSPAAATEEDTGLAVRRGSVSLTGFAFCLPAKR
jgi:hypothetical protein